MRKIDVSFKNTTTDIFLYTYVSSQEEKSIFVKKALSYYIDYLELKNKKGKQ